MYTDQAAPARRAGDIRFGVLPSTISLRIREPGSAISHFIAFILLIAGAGPALMQAKAHGSWLTVLGVHVFLATSMLLYAASTIYHTVVLDRDRTRIFKKMDHMMISVMIAGTYTPVCLTVLAGRTGTILLIAIWLMAIGGIILKALWVTCPRWVSSILYLVMGWLCIFALIPLFELLPTGGFLWLLAGGISYSVGALIYALRLPLFNLRHKYFGSHEIFHLFIMGGTFCHYIFMIRYLVFYK